MTAGEVHVRAPAAVPELCGEPRVPGPGPGGCPGLWVQVLPELGPLPAPPARPARGTTRLHSVHTPGH